MKKITLSLVLCFGFVGSAVAGDDKFELMSINPNGLSLSEISELCTADDTKDIKACYSFARGLMAGYRVGREAEQQNMNEICIPVGNNEHGIAEFIATIFSKPMLEQMKPHMTIEAEYA